MGARPVIEPGPRTRSGLYRTKREALKYLGLAVLFGAVLWTATLIVYLVFSGKAHG